MSANPITPFPHQWRFPQPPPEQTTTHVQLSQISPISSQVPQRQTTPPQMATRPVKSKITMAASNIDGTPFALQRPPHPHHSATTSIDTTSSADSPFAHPGAFTRLDTSLTFPNLTAPTLPELSLGTSFWANQPAPTVGLDEMALSGLGWPFSVPQLHAPVALPEAPEGDETSSAGRSRSSSGQKRGLGADEVDFDDMDLEAHLDLSAYADEGMLGI